MKKGFVALSVLSGMFLASSALAAPKWIGIGGSQTTASITVDQFSDLKFSSSTANKFNGYIKAGEPLFDLTINAPQGMQVAIAGVVNSMAVSTGSIRNNEYDAGNELTSIHAVLADASVLKGSEYIPEGGKDRDNSGAAAIVVDGTGADVNINFISRDEKPKLTPGKYGYTFIAQAFTE